jgi:hypothetical protein
MHGHSMSRQDSLDVFVGVDIGNCNASVVYKTGLGEKPQLETFDADGRLPTTVYLFIEKGKGKDQDEGPHEEEQEEEDDFQDDGEQEKDQEEEQEQEEENDFQDDGEQEKEQRGRE